MLARPGKYIINDANALERAVEQAQYYTTCHTLSYWFGDSFLSA